ncbi:PucR family transcriptional regulator [Streptomyces fuscigenes]|uniref:PucR family transcriptional regulator n=1 Tax=Streptomyces fuscigenes TaxID=1528880 RepID=UPI001F26F925|nr:helix-turn-helix domain-containing protein [Streptomyces fuscigenes]MCF3960100.1 helix-turn-helix domain-containing protein [Streptomyces fuscigenes]
MCGSRAHELPRRHLEPEAPSPPGSAARLSSTARGVAGPSVSDGVLAELAALSRALLDTRDEGEILRLAMDHIGVAGPYSAEAGYLQVDDYLVPGPRCERARPAVLDPRVRELDGQDGPVAVPGRTWCWALGLRGTEGLRGYLVVGARSRPTEADYSALTMLVRDAACALSLAFLRRRRRDDAAELYRLREERSCLQRQLTSVAADLGHARALHALMSDFAASGGGEEAVTRGLHRLTGLPALVEDRFGRLRSWSGPSCPDPYPEPNSARQDEMLHTVAREAGPVQVKDRLAILVRPHGEILGVLALVDARREADEHTKLALEDAASSLAREMDHERRLAEMELRLHGELADDLLRGTDEASACARCLAAGIDVYRCHYIVVVQWSNRRSDASFAGTVARAASVVGMRSVLARRADHVVLVTDEESHPHALYEAIAREAGTHSGAVGVSSRCDALDSIPHHYQEALRALKVGLTSGHRGGVTFYDELGLYRILGPGSGYGEMETFVHDWLGQLIDYDSRHHTALVETLSRYFDCGGNYSATAEILVIHRSTLRYRLQRIRDITGRDLTNVEDRLNLQVATRVWKVVLGGPG